MVYFTCELCFTIRQCKDVGRYDTCFELACPMGTLVWKVSQILCSNLLAILLLVYDNDKGLKRLIFCDTHPTSAQNIQPTFRVNSPE